MSDVEDVRSKINIVDIIGAKVVLKKAGRNLKGLCPFHGEKTPSFVVSPDRQMFHCFGCHKGGTVFDFYMFYYHVDFAEALEELAHVAGVTLTRRFGDTPQDKLKQKIYEVNHMASEFYHYLLTKHAHGANARAYLANRGISDKSIKTFSLGYSPHSWDGLLKFLRKKGYDEQLMEQAGLVIPRRFDTSSPRNGYYDRFRGRVMFTLKDHRGQVLGFAGRVLDAKEKEAKYINTSETPVYIKSNVLYGLDVTKGTIQKENNAVIMEGELDVISSFQEGVSNVVAIKGSALTEGHVNLLRRFTQTVTFALDSDMAGDAAARRGIEIADKAGLDMRVVVMPSGKDPDDAVRENPVAFKKAIADALPIYDYFLASAQKRYDTTTAFGKKKISDELLPILAKMENPIVQGHYIRELARAITTPEETVMSALRRFSRTHVVDRKSTETESPPQRSRVETIEFYMLALLLQGKTVELMEDLTEDVRPADLSQPAIRAVVAKLGQHLAAHPVFLLKDFLDSLPTELAQTVDEALLWDITPIIDNENLYAGEWAKILGELKKSLIRKKIVRMTAGLQEDSVDGGQTEEEVKQLTGRLKTLEKSS